MSRKRAKAFMVLGTASGVGKSFLTAGLCRILSDAGIRVAPFKAQNMSNNSFVTREGGEMGRAQVVQAQCARVEPGVDMNPVLLKPAADDGSQVVVHGKPIGTLKARTYYGMRERISQAIQESYERLAREFEVLVIEGAGSPAEINLRDFDLVNFRVAEMADAECLLVGDIDRGGVFASLWGTLALLEEPERERVRGLVINKFRGDRSLLDPGLRMLENLTGKKVLGVLPYTQSLWLEEEDAVGLEEGPGPSGKNQLDIAVILLPRISNATDFQVLAQEPGVSVRMVRRVEEFGAPDLVVLPGTKATLPDLSSLHQRGLSRKIKEYAEKRGRILGICGGFQMLGERIEDPEGVESKQGGEDGLALLPLRTQFSPEKTLRRVKGRIHNEIFSHRVEGELEGYEIHMGQTEGRRPIRPLFEVTDADLVKDWTPEGAVDPTGRILGTYVHGVFDQASFRASFLSALWESSGKQRPAGADSKIPSLQALREINYQLLASFLRENLELNFLEQCLKSSSLSV